MSSLRQMWENLVFIQNVLNSETDMTREQKLNALKPFKADIRNEYKRLEENASEVHYSEDGESCWFKEYFYFPFTEEEKEEYIECNRREINSPYDCTGQWFTRWITICNVETSFGAKSVVYHALGLDV